MMSLTPYEYLLIDVANHFGLDKESYEKRLAWADKHEADLESLTEDADVPELFMAATMALRDIQNGKPTGHLIGFDAAASGLQIMAAITKCHVTAENTGLIGHKRADMYSTCTRVMARLLDADVDVTRKEVKSAQMPMFYGSKKRPKQVFGEGEELEAFYDANKQVAPNACELLEDLLMSWQAYEMYHSWDMPDGYHAYIPVMVQDERRVEIAELKSTITYSYKVNCGQEQGLSNAANIIHSIDAMVVRELVRRCNYNLNKMETVMRWSEQVIEHSEEPIKEHEYVRLWRESGFLSLAAVDRITPFNIQQFPSEFLSRLCNKIEAYKHRPSFEVVTIHDEFKCHANYMQYVRMTYREIMAELSESTILKFLMGQIYKMDVDLQYGAVDENLPALIREGTYAIT